MILLFTQTLHYALEHDVLFLRYIHIYYFFVSYHACILGSIMVYCPVGLENFLKGKFKGMLITAIALDAKNLVFLLAIGILGELENKSYSGHDFFVCHLPLIGGNVIPTC